MKLRKLEDGILTFRAKPHKKVRKYIKFCNDFKKIFAKFKPDLIHANVCLGSGQLALIGKIFYKIPYIVTEHAPIQMILDEKMTKNIKQRFLYDITTKNSSCNIAVSPYLKNELNSKFKNGNFIYIPNGVRVIKNIEKIKVNKNIKNLSIIAAFYSKKIKGFQYLLPAIKKIIAVDKNIHLHVCGDGEYLEYYRNMANKLEIEDYITFYGNCDRARVYGVLNQMDFNVSASIFESAGVAVEEACMIGKPQVITKSGGANSLIPNKYSIKVDTNSVDSLYFGITEMMKQYSEFDECEIRNYGIKNFEISNVCNEHLKVYKQVIKNYGE